MKAVLFALTFIALIATIGCVQQGSSGGIEIGGQQKQQVCGCESQPQIENCGCEKELFGLGDLKCGTWIQTAQCSWACSKGNEEYVSSYSCEYV